MQIDEEEDELVPGDDKWDFGKRECPTCGREFTARRSWARFCGTRCRMRDHQLERKLAVAEYRAMKKQRFEKLEEKADGE